MSNLYIRWSHFSKRRLISMIQMLDYLFATIPPSIICYYISQYGLLPQLPGGIAADRKGRHSSDVTVGYIRTQETPHHCFSPAGNQDVVTTQRRRIILEKKPHVGFH
ncbi:hypothetical protein ILYODFUR_033079 [Ilyodon furcidens]|uniref:Uncharacterized protein n=1 Tax=Ilyodon furcidens TaxID=33524 RepID=A0ABV0VLJ2_9TELE